MYTWAIKARRWSLKSFQDDRKLNATIVTEPIESATMVSDDGLFRAIANTRGTRFPEATDITCKHHTLSIA